MSERFGFDERKRAAVDENTTLSLMSGLAIRYHDELKRGAKALERLASIPNDPTALALQTQIPKIQRVATVKAPMAFSLEPSNMAVSINAIKVDPNTGTEIPHSAIQVGLVGGLAGDGQPSRDFTNEDLTLATERLKEQRQAGLVYGMPTSSGFLRDY